MDDSCNTGGNNSQKGQDANETRRAITAGTSLFAQPGKEGAQVNEVALSYTTVSVWAQVQTFEIASPGFNGGVFAPFGDAEKDSCTKECTFVVFQKTEQGWIPVKHLYPTP